MAKLNPKQLEFIRQFILNGGNASKAYEDAGYTSKSPHVDASKLLANPNIQQEIKIRQMETEAKLEEKFELSQDAILDELIAVGFGNFGDVADWDNEKGLTIKDKSKITKRGLSFIDSMKVQRGVTMKKVKGQKEKKAEFYIKDIKIGTLGKEKVKALELLGKQIGMFDGRTGNDKDSRKLILERLQRFLQKDRGNRSGSGS